MLNNSEIPINSHFILLGNENDVRKENIWLERNRKINKHSNCYIAFLDILGFKALFSTQDKKKIQETLENFTEYTSRAIHKRRNNADELTRGEDSKQKQNHNKATEILMISDSIVIKTNDATHDSLAAITDTAIDLVWAGFSSGVPLRGCITKNSMLKCDLDDKSLNLKMNIYWSQGIIDTFIFEKQMQIAGCMFLKDVEPQMPNFFKQYPEYKKKIQNYPIPMKDEKEKEYSADGFIINWTTSPFFKTSMANPDGTKDAKIETIEKAFLRNKDKDHLGEKELKKLENTLQFYNTMHANNKQ